MNELLVPEAMRLSKKVEQVTRFKLKDDKYGSENFQVMNYGIGGRISTHLDSVGGRTKDTSEAEEVGGFRVTTFMVYMSDVQAGGRTIFPSHRLEFQLNRQKEKLYFGTMWALEVISIRGSFIWVVLSFMVTSGLPISGSSCCLNFKSFQVGGDICILLLWIHTNKVSLLL